MVKITSFLGILFVLISCMVHKKINCTNDEKISKIDTSLWYIEKVIKPNLELDSRINETYIKFKKNGEVAYYYKQDEKIKKIPEKYERGIYFVRNNDIYFNSFFYHPQGGGWVKHILSRNKNDTLYFRPLERCEENYIYTCCISYCCLLSKVLKYLGNV